MPPKRKTRRPPRNEHHVRLWVRQSVYHSWNERWKQDSASLLRFCYIELQFRLHNPLQTRGEGLTRTTIKIISHQLFLSSSLLASLFYLHEMYFNVANPRSDPKFILYSQVKGLCLHRLQCKGLAIVIVNQTSKILFARICIPVFFFSSSTVYK